MGKNMLLQKKLWYYSKLGLGLRILINSKVYQGFEPNNTHQQLNVTESLPGYTYEQLNVSGYIWI